MKRIDKVRAIINAGVIMIDDCNLEDPNPGSVYWLSNAEIDIIYNETVECIQGATTPNTDKDKKSKGGNTTMKKRYYISECNYNRIDNKTYYNPVYVGEHGNVNAAIRAYAKKSNDIDSNYYKVYKAGKDEWIMSAINNRYSERAGQDVIVQYSIIA